MRTITVHSLYTLTEVASKELVENVDLREREPYRRANVGPRERKLMGFISFLIEGSNILKRKLVPSKVDYLGVVTAYLNDTPTP